MGGRIIAVRCTTLRCTLWKVLQRSVVASYGGSYARTRAPPVHHADLAPWPACDADAPPMLDQRVREPGPPLARHERHEVPLDLHRILLPGEAEQRGQALHVRVHDDPFVFPEPRPQHHVRGLAADAREL